MINRTVPPPTKEISTISYLAPTSKLIAKNTYLHWINEVSNEGFKLDFIFKAGTIFEEKIIAKLTADLIFSGTPDKTSEQINDEIDQYGGFVNVEVTAEDATLSLFGLKENFIDLLNIVVDALEQVTFPKRELDQLVATKRQSFLIAQQKVAIQARQHFLTSVFEGTPFSRVTYLEDFDNVDAKKIKTFYAENYLKGLKMVCLIGDIDEQKVDYLTSKVSAWCTDEVEKPSYSFKNKATKIHVEKEDAVQTAIRIGRLLFNKKHEDYISFGVLNTVLGGYFGSRLMTKIREEKGYTYGIGSGVAQSVHTGYFFIATEVGKAVKEEALEAIKNEIKLLQEEFISEEELSLIRSYSIGQLLSQSDGPFAMMDRFLSVERFGMGFEYYDKVLNTINNITVEEIRDLARKYLNWQDMIIVTAG